MQNITEGLNSEQTSAVKHIHGALFVMAPIGTGKTKVLAHRAAYAVGQDINPGSMLCLSFTNKASKEMRSRVQEMLPESYRDIRINTFHGFCTFLLRTDGDRLGLHADFTIFDDEDMVEMVRQNVAGLEGLKSNDIYTLIENAKLLGKFNNYLKPDDLTRYNNAIRENHALDFIDLIQCTQELLSTFSDIRQKWQNRFNWIQVDEFQDTNHHEYQIIRMLAVNHKNIAFFGDLDQTIYEWRGSEPKVITKDIYNTFSPVKQILFTRNYRSTRNILKAAWGVINHYPGKTTLEISPQVAEEGEPVYIHNADSIEKEGRFIAEEILRLNREKNADFGKIAVLTRTNGHAADMSYELSKAGVPHFLVDQFKFFKRTEIKDMLALLETSVNLYNTNALKRVLLRTAEGIGEVTIKKILNLPQELGCRLTDFLRSDTIEHADPFRTLIDAYNNNNIVIFDTETTGLNFAQDDIIEIAAVRYGRDGIKEEFQKYIKTNRSLEETTHVHGITEEMLASEGEEPRSVLSAFLEFSRDAVICGHNVVYDLNMTSGNCQRNDLQPFRPAASYDTLDLSRRFLRSERYTLTALKNLLGLPTQPTHRALDDVKTTAELLSHLITIITKNEKERKEAVTVYINQFRKFYEKVTEWRRRAQTERPADLFDYIIQNSGLAEQVSRMDEADRRQMHLKELRNIMMQFDDPQLGPEESLRSILSTAALGDDRDRLVGAERKVSVITAHQSKGLEFDTVFIAGVFDQGFPGYFAVKENKLSEEHRLFYVCITRAKERLYITYPAVNNWGRKTLPSRFLKYISEEVVRRV
ncbi:MAG: UvrD-helicase domain-containing protein [Ignavibacteriaceae bacterium]|nr:UvrD-helicase domain-containing protein [Ignavibacteriaceae bacterium]